MKKKKTERANQIHKDIFRMKREIRMKEELQKKRAVSARMQRVTGFMNRYSLLFHILLACSVCFVIEWISRHSFLEACEFVIDRNLVFLYNSMIVYASLILVYLVKRRMALRVTISAFWLFLGTINGCVLAKRVTPFGYTDLKMVGDLFTMQSNYFSAKEAMLVILGVSAAILLLVLIWIKGPKYSNRIRRIPGITMVAAVMLMVPMVTKAAVSSNILTEYFENLAQGYKDYGFVYSFSASVVDRGMSAPDEYSEEAVDAVLARVNKDVLEQTVIASAQGENDDTKPLEKMNWTKTMSSAEKQEQNNESEQEIPGEDSEDMEYPNIICILLESFVNPDLIRFIETDEDPIPNFHYLYDNYTSGYLTVPVVGAGTANTEFEILTGMGMQFFGLGEYPYKTVLKKTNCESIAADLKTLGYGAHAVHNNGGNFYSRAHVFSMMGFDTFTSKELMDIQDYTPIGTWPTDDILVGEVEKSLDYTPNQPDFVYTITVEGHGDYPKEKVLEDPDIAVTAQVEEEGMQYAWEYYVNQLHEVDEFIGDLIDMLEQREEKTFVVMFGDHLPTMGLTEEDMTTGSLFQTQYATWNNFGLEKEDSDMTAYQLLADMTAQLGISNGTMFTYHQQRDTYASEEEYQTGMELLQYDILYGEHYVYGGENPYPASELVMGTQEVVLDRIVELGDYYYIVGSNFTKWSKLYVDEERVSTTYISSERLRIKKSKLEPGEHQIVVQQTGSSETCFRKSNTLLYNKEEEAE